MPVRRAPRSPPGRRSLLPRRGPARPPPTATGRPRPPLPARDAPAEPRRSSPQRAATRGAAAVMAAPSGPRRPSATASERPARRRAPPLAPSRPGSGSSMSADIGRRGGFGSTAGKSARREIRGQEWAGNGGGDLAQRGLGSPGAGLALGGGAGRPSAPAEALRTPIFSCDAQMAAPERPHTAQSGARADRRPS